MSQVNLRTLRNISPIVGNSTPSGNIAVERSGSTSERERERNYGRSLPKSRFKNTEIKKVSVEENSLDFSRYKRTNKMRIAGVVEFRDSYNGTTLKFK